MWSSKPSPKHIHLDRSAIQSDAGTSMRTVTQAMETTQLSTGGWTPREGRYTHTRAVLVCSPQAAVHWRVDTPGGAVHTRAVLVSSHPGSCPLMGGHPGRGSIHTCAVLVSSHPGVSDSVTPRTAARQASLSLTISQSLPKFTSIASLMPSSRLILRRPLLLLPSISPSIRDFSNSPAVCIRWPRWTNYSSIKKNERVICSYTDGPRDYHCKWNKSDRKTNTIYHLYVECKIRPRWTSL